MIGVRDLACVVWRDGTIAVYRGWSRGRAEVVGVYDNWAHLFCHGLPADWLTSPAITIHTTFETTGGSKFHCADTVTEADPRD